MEIGLPLHVAHRHHKKVHEDEVADSQRLVPPQHLLPTPGAGARRLGNGIRALVSEGCCSIVWGTAFFVSSIQYQPSNKDPEFLRNT